MIVDGVNDVRVKGYVAKTVRELIGWLLQDEEKAKFEKEVLPQWVGYFETLVGKNKSGFMVGDKVLMVES